LQFLARFLSRRGAPLIGLDIGSSGVRLAQLGTAEAGGWTLECLGTEPLDKGWVSEGQIEDFDAVVAAIRRVVARSGASQRRVALALPAASVMTRRLLLPAGLRDDELEQLVRLEAEQHIPFPLDEVSLDFGVVGPVAGSAEQVEVVVAAARQERIQDRQGVAEAAGLVPAVMDIDSHASQRALRHWMAGRSLAAPGALLAWVELDPGTLRLKVLQDSATLHEHEYRSEPAAAAVEAADTQVARRIAQALQQFFASAPHHAVDHVLLSGPGASSPGLARRVADLTGFDAVRVDPFEGMVAAPGARELLAREASACLVACGLAMRKDSA